MYSCLCERFQPILRSTRNDATSILGTPAAVDLLLTTSEFVRMSSKSLLLLLTANAVLSPQLTGYTKYCGSNAVDIRQVARILYLLAIAQNLFAQYILLNCQTL